MVDGSKGFIKDGNKNRLRAQDIHKIVDIFTSEAQLDGYSRMVSLEEVAGNEYNLNIPRYIDSSDPEDLHDLSGHLQGGIPNRDIDSLGTYWQVFPTLRKTLFTEASRAGYSDCLVEASKVKTTILNHPEFTSFAETALNLFHGWKDEHEQKFKTLAVGDDSKELIKTVAEDLLSRFCKADLLDKYDIYQILMDYWSETMQDDAYIIVQDGWQAGTVLRQLIVKKGEKLKETPDLIIGKNKYKADLIPPQLLIATYLSAEQDEIDRLQGVQDAISQEIESFIEEHGGEDGLLEDAKNDKDKVTKASIIARKKEVKVAGDKDELAVLDKCLSLFAAETAAKKKVKDAQLALDQKVFAHYPKLTDEEVQILVVDRKWMAHLAATISAEIERITQQLAGRVKTLEERYAEPLPQLVSDVEKLAGKVGEHLKKMGLSW